MFWYIVILLIILLIFLKKKRKNGKEGFDKNYLDGIDIIYWINLDRSTDRKESMEQIFKDDVFTNTPNKRISGIDAANTNLKNKIKSFDLNKYNPGVYGCLLSHFECLQTFNKSNYDIALIMEDDVTLEFKKYWKKSVREIINNAPKDWEIIQLCYIIDEKHELWDWKNMKSNYTNLTPSTAAYIINKKGSKKMIDTVFDGSKYTLDPSMSHHSDRYIYETLKTYTYKYPFFIYKTENESLLGHNIDAHNDSKENIIKQYENIQYENTIKLYVNRIS